MRSRGSERGGDLPVVTQIVSHSDSRACSFGLPSIASFFLFSLSFGHDLLNPFYVPVIALRSKGTEGSKTDLAPSFQPHDLEGKEAMGIITSITVTKEEDQSPMGV